MYCISLTSPLALQQKACINTSSILRWLLDSRFFRINTISRMKRYSSAVAEGREGGCNQKIKCISCCFKPCQCLLQEVNPLHPQSSQHGSAPEPITRCPCAPGAGLTGSLAGKGRDKYGSAIFPAVTFAARPCVWFGNGVSCETLSDGSCRDAKLIFLLTPEKETG